jgi:hypothetical protein
MEGEYPLRTDKSVAHNAPNFPVLALQ